MITIKKALVVAFKDISIAFHIIGMRLTLELQREYNTIKVNYYYDKVEEDIEKWLVKIDHIIEVNNIIVERRVAIVVTYLRNTITD